jgi:hypothetical protein
MAWVNKDLESWVSEPLDIPATPNPFLNLLSAQFKQTFINAIDSVLDSSGLTLPCQLTFADTTYTECPNCVYDTMSQMSSNVYKTGGPIVFTQGNCPYCRGIGTIAIDNISLIYMVVLWNYKDWIGWQGIPDQSMTPFGQVQTLSKMTTLPDIKNAKEVLLDVDIAKYVQHRFQRVGEPNPIGFGTSSYIATMWKRIG